MSILQIVQLDASDMDNFSYLIFCPKRLEGAAIDPSLWPERLLEKAQELGVKLKLLLNTHGHADHIAGNQQILNTGDIKLAAHPLDLPSVDIPTLDGTILKIGDGSLRTLHTPGHTPGSVVFQTKDAIITGDTLFVSRCGRADFPNSDPTALYNSLQRLKELPPETRVFPGHNYGPTMSSTIGWERDNNEYLKCQNLRDFIDLRMG